MNKELLLKTANAIEANPSHFDMGNWFGGNSCGTTACIAGWAWHLEHQENLNQPLIESRWQWLQSLSQSFSTLLDLDDVEYIGGDADDGYTEFESLAYVVNWLNSEMRDAFESEIHRETKARIAAEYVRWFVRTDGGKTEVSE